MNKIKKTKQLSYLKRKTNITDIYTDFIEGVLAYYVNLYCTELCQ